MAAQIDRGESRGGGRGMKVGLMLPLGQNDALGRPLSWPELRAMAEAADTAAWIRCGAPTTSSSTTRGDGRHPRVLDRR